jgi:hypothetical protein
MEVGERVRKILFQHLGIEPARKVPTVIKDRERERELAEAAQLRVSTKEEVDITLEELMGEIEDYPRRSMQTS